MIKKLLALILALLMLLLMTSCGGDSDVPEDMQSATLAGEPFSLYVPKSWVLNVGSGVSGAFISPNDKTMVTARYYTPEQEMTVEEYVTLCADGYKSMPDFCITERAPAVLGGKDAVKLTYTVTENGRSMTCFQITTLHNGDMVSLHGYCPTDLWSLREEEFGQIISVFVLREKSVPQGEELTDKQTPDGFEIASAEKIEYRMYVPKNWICDAASGISEAYYPESEKSNVTVTSYTPSESISVQDHFAACEEEYRTTLPNYERTDEPTQRTLGGRTAYTYTYRATVDGVEFCIMQTICAYNEMIYSFTYTATAEKYDLHMNDVEAMLNAFRFR